MVQTANTNPEKMLPLTPAVFHILLVLADKPKHGYAIMKTVKELNDGRVKMGPGTFYGSIKRLLESGLIEESEQRPDPDLDDERRRYYRLTPFGQKVLRAEAERLSRLVQVARSKRVFDSSTRGD